MGKIKKYLVLDTETASLPFINDDKYKKTFNGFIVSPFKKVYMHLYEFVRENIERKYGTLNAEEFVELLPTLIDYYFDNNIKDRLDNFLMKKAKVLYAPKKQRILIGSLAPKEEEKLNFVVNHYALKLYEGIKSLNPFNSKKSEREVLIFFMYPLYCMCKFKL